ncbi:unnamed protein product [Peniophora sp. CBMAI 1063]|nr:unnamed protein product [Peniophora sp. CBMAI 1063]
MASYPAQAKKTHPVAGVQDRLAAGQLETPRTRIRAFDPRPSRAPVETFCTILDLKNVSISNFYRVKDYVGKATQIGQDRYPEVMGKFYIINAPWGFSAVWGIVKGWLDPVTAAKIDVCGSDYKGKLLDQTPAENLPKEYGGTYACHGSCSLSDAGPWNETAAPAQAPAAA